MEITDLEVDTDCVSVMKTEATEDWRRKLLIAIQSKDIGDTCKLLDTAPGPLPILLNESLVDCKVTDAGRYTNCEPSENYRFTLPLNLAVIYASFDILVKICEAGADVFGQDAEGDNIIHTLCWAAAFKPEKEIVFCELYVRLLTFVETMEAKRRLLYMEDLDGFRPLELAARLGAMQLMMGILETENVYKFIVASSPIGRKIRYDLTEYESSVELGIRHPVSPLQFLRKMYDSDVEKPGTMAMFQHPVFQKWLVKKTRDATLLIFNDCVFSILTILGFTITDDFGRDNSCPANSTNTTRIDTSNTSKWVVLYFGAIFYLFIATIIVGLSVWNFVKGHGSYSVQKMTRPKSLRGNGQRRLATGTCFIVIYILEISLLTLYVLVTLTVPQWTTGTLGEIMLLVRVILQVVFWWGFLYFIQLLPGIGHLVTGAFRCLDIFVYFILIFLLFFVASAEGVRTIANYYCLDKVGYSLDSFYSTFLIMLNMISTRDLNDHLSQPPWPLVLMHIHIVFILVVLLMNFLIALLSDEVAKIERHRFNIRSLIKLNMVMESLTVYEGARRLLPKCLRHKKERFYIEYDEYCF